jgi:hypothetical protein
MTQPPTGDPGPRPAPPLEYAHKPAGLPTTWQATLGAVIAAASVLGGAFAGGLFGGMAGTIVVPLLLIALFVLLAVSFRGHENTRGWAAGFLIGVGVGILLDGLCWVAVFSLVG